MKIHIDSRIITRCCLVLLLLSHPIGCGLQKDTIRTHFTTQNQQHPLNVEFKCPQNANLLHLTGSHGEEYQYWFQDSSVFYINTDKSTATLNYENLISGHDEVNYLSYEFLDVNDTLVESGIETTTGKLWKEIIFYQGYVRIGYMNVSSYERVKFEEYLSDVVIKE